MGCFLLLTRLCARITFNMVMSLVQYPMRADHLYARANRPLFRLSLSFLEEAKWSILSSGLTCHISILRLGVTNGTFPRSTGFFGDTSGVVVEPIPVRCTGLIITLIRH